MKSGTIVALALIGVAAAVIGLRYWQGVGKATDEPVLTEQGRQFAQTAYRMLHEAVSLDDEAVKRARVAAARTFAQHAGNEHRQLLQELDTAIRKVDPDFAYPAAEQAAVADAAPWHDRTYVDQFLKQHEQARAFLAQNEKQLDQGLSGFASLWSNRIARHTSDARQLLANLPRVASNMPLLLLAGITSLALAAALRVRGKITCRVRL